MPTLMPFDGEFKPPRSESAKSALTEAEQELLARSGRRLFELLSGPEPDPSMFKDPDKDIQTPFKFVRAAKLRQNRSIGDEVIEDREEELYKPLGSSPKIPLVLSPERIRKGETLTEFWSVRLPESDGAEMTEKIFKRADGVEQPKTDMENNAGI